MASHHSSKAAIGLLNGKKQLEAKDGTFAKPGKFGLRTKADAQTYFDSLDTKEIK